MERLNEEPLFAETETLNLSMILLLLFMSPFSTSFRGQRSDRRNVSMYQATYPSIRLRLTAMRKTGVLVTTECDGRGNHQNRE